MYWFKHKISNTEVEQAEVYRSTLLKRQNKKNFGLSLME